MKIIINTINKGMMTMVLILCELMSTIVYLLTETIQVNDKAEYQYIQAKLSNIETNLCLVKYLLKGIE